MKSYAFIPGRVGNHGELKFIGETCKFGFTLAANRREKVNNEWVDVPTWWTVEIWGKQAEYLAKKMIKGDPVTVVGEPYVEKWMTRDQQKRETLRLKASEVTIHARFQASGSAQAETPAADPAGPPSEHPPRSPAPAGGDDEPPF